MSKNIKINGENYNGVQIIKTELQGSGSYAEFVDTSDANATSSDVLVGKTCYVDGEKVVGTKVDSGSGETIKLQEKTITDNGTYTADSGFGGLSKVTVNVEKGITPTGTKDITANGTHDVTNFASVNVNVPTGGSTGEVANFPFPHNNIQTGSFTPTEDEISHEIVCNFAPKGFICIIAGYDKTPSGGVQYSGAAWYYLSNGHADCKFSGHRFGGEGKAIIGASSTGSTVVGNVVTIDSNVVNATQRLIAGRTYNWVAWDY